MRRAFALADGRARVRLSGPCLRRGPDVEEGNDDRVFRGRARRRNYEMRMQELGDRYAQNFGAQPQPAPVGANPELVALLQQRHETHGMAWVREMGAPPRATTEWRPDMRGPPGLGVQQQQIMRVEHFHIASWRTSPRSTRTRRSCIGETWTRP